MLASLIPEIKRKFPALSLRENEPMSNHTSLRIGGPAAAMAFPASSEQTAALCRFLRQKGVKPFVMGNGTNLLVTDGAFDRFVVKTGEGAGRVFLDGETMTAECGALLSQAAAAALEANLTGLEFAAGIPGTVGGAVCMNAGAYGGEMKDVCDRTEYLNEDLELCVAEGAAQDFSYRHSAFSDADVVILRTVFSLKPGDREAVGSKMRELAQKRRASQPLDKPSAGSTFKRPAQGYAAAHIDEAGLKGFAIGGAMVSPKHAGFVINEKNASFEDVLRLIEHIQKTVYDRSGVLLEPEVKILRR